MEKRDTIFIERQLSSRSDFRECKRYERVKSYRDLINMMEKIGKRIGIDIRSISDESTGVIEDNKERTFLVALSFKNLSTDYRFVLDRFTGKGAPFLLITNKDAYCDYIKLFFQNKEPKRVSAIKFGCFKTRDTKKKIVEKCKRKYCKAKITKGNLMLGVDFLVNNFSWITKLKRIPLYHYSFMFDFLLWQWIFGEALFITQFEQRFQAEIPRTFQDKEKILNILLSKK